MAEPSTSVQEHFAILSLDRIPKGIGAVVIELDKKLRRIRRLTDLGLVPGAPVEVRGRTPFGSLLLLKVMGSLISLPADDARLIQVRAEGLLKN